MAKLGSVLRVATAVMLVAIAALPLQAEYIDDPSFQVCTNATGYYDIAATNDWLQRLKTTDFGAMKEVAGKWYAEFYNEQMGMSYNNTITYLETGVMDFTTRTCSTTGCSDDYGHGLFTAHRAQDGSIFITRNLTSLTRINQCGGFYLQMDNGVLVTQDGKRWRKLN